MKYLVTVKQFLVLLLFLFQTETYAANQCENLFPIKSGAQILHEIDPTLQSSNFVQKLGAKHKRQTGVALTNPKDRINQFLTFLTKISNRAESSPKTLEQIKTILNNRYVIKADKIPESHFALQAKIAKERGFGEIALTSDQKNQLAETIIADQKMSLETWTEYLVSKDSKMYPMWVKYWMFTAMTKLGKYDVKTGRFSHRDEFTVAPFVELNHEALALVVDSVLKHVNKESLEDMKDPQLVQLLAGFNFGKIYGHILFKLGFGKEGAFKSNQGRWVIYKQGSDHRPLVESLKGHNTGWCTAAEGTAKSQLQEGDFHVYYSLDDDGHPTRPRVAIRMEGDEIAEVRGVAEKQNLDPQINQTHVVSSKMKEFGSKADKFKKRDHDMKLLTQIETKQKTKVELSKEEIFFLYELNGKIEGFGYKKDPRIEKIKAERDLKSDIAFAFDNKYTRDEITTTMEEFNLGKSKIHFGNLDFWLVTNAEKIKLPQILIGRLNLADLTTAIGLELPERMVGDLLLTSLTEAKGLKFPKTLDGDLDLYSLTSAEGVELPITMNGLLNLSSLTSTEGLKLPSTMNGNLFLDGLRSASGLELPDPINGTLTLNGLTSAEGLKLPKILGKGLKIKLLTSPIGLILPEVMNGYLSLPNLSSAKDLKLPKGVTDYVGPNDIQK